MRVISSAPYPFFNQEYLQQDAPLAECRRGPAKTALLISVLREAWAMSRGQGRFLSAISKAVC